MQNKKVYIVLIVILIVFFFVMFFAFGVKNILREDDQLILLVGDHTIWTYQNKMWNEVYENSDIEKLNWQEYEVFSDNQKLGNYYLWHDDKWYAFDQDRSSVSLPGSLLAYQSNYEVSLVPFQEEEIGSTSYIEKVLTSYNLSPKSRLTSSSKVVLDFDQDGKMEEFYAISNAFSTEFKPDVIFSLAFMVKDNSIYMIYEDVGNTYFDACRPFFRSFINVDYDLPYEVILGCGGYSRENEVNSLYQFSNNSFKTLISSNN